MSFLFWKYRIYFLFMNYSTLLSRKLSEKLGCQSSGTSEELLSCFQQVSKLNHNIFCYFKFYFKFTLYHALANVFFFAHFCGTSICTSVFFWILRHLSCVLGQHQWNRQTSKNVWSPRFSSHLHPSGWWLHHWSFCSKGSLGNYWSWRIQPDSNHHWRKQWWSTFQCSSVLFWWSYAWRIVLKMGDRIWASLHFSSVKKAKKKLTFELITLSIRLEVYF